MAMLPAIRQAVGRVGRAISSLVSRGRGNAEIIAEATRATAAYGAGAVIDTSVIEQLAAYDRAIGAAAATLAAAPDNAMISPAMWAAAPWSADLATFTAAPSWRARIEILSADEQGNITSSWRYVDQVDVRGMTTADLTAAMNGAAATFIQGTTPGGGIGGTLQGVRDIQLTIGPAS